MDGWMVVEGRKGGGACETTVDHPEKMCVRVCVCGEKGGGRETMRMDGWTDGRGGAGCGCCCVTPSQDGEM